MSCFIWVIWVFLNYSIYVLCIWYFFSFVLHSTLYDLTELWCFTLNLRILMNYYFLINKLCSLIPFTIFFWRLNFIVVLDTFSGHLSYPGAVICLHLWYLPMVTWVCNPQLEFKEWLDHALLIFIMPRYFIIYFFCLFILPLIRI